MKNVGASRIIVICILLFTIKIAGGHAMKRSLSQLLPDEVPGWSIEDGDHFYDAKTLYDYIDGGAELFLSFGFQQVINRIYTAPDQPDILLDIFDMGNSRNAYGVFSHSREKEDSTFGQGSQYVAGLLLFWKGRYYVSILFTPETEKAKAAAFSIAGHIEKSIKEEGPIPDIIRLLPEQGLLRGTIRYFRHYVWLNSYYFISNENILDIGDGTEAVLAKYNGSDKRHLLLLVEYPNQQKAMSAKASFVKNYLPALEENGIARNDDGKWVECQVSNRYLFIVFSSADKEAVRSLTEKVRQTIQKKSER